VILLLSPGFWTSLVAVLILGREKILPLDLQPFLWSLFKDTMILIAVFLWALGTGVIYAKAAEPRASESGG
jgi:hypothetical protein